VRTLFGFMGVLALIVVVGFLAQLALGSYTVVSENMRPELQIGDRLLVNKLAYSFSEPGRGDIVIYQNVGSNEYQMKRVIGLPGDVIETKNQIVYVNGVELNEPYARQSKNIITEEFSVPPQNYFVLEDNRNSLKYISSDNYVPEQSIEGQVWILAWPLDRVCNVANFANKGDFSSESDPSLN
jgi:signal peptidase I